MERSLTPAPRRGRVVAIVGMHRSGTSCLAGTLEQAGLYLGKVITEAPHNAKGNRENRRIMDLHEAVLVHSGGSWDKPPERLSWSEAQSEERDDIIRSYGDAPVWGFKCPRTLVTLAFWREAVPELSFVGTFRHPLLVAESLCKRNGGSRDTWLALWQIYNERLLSLHAAAAFPILRFDTDVDTYGRSLRAVATTLGFTGPLDLTFFEPELRHHRDPPEGELSPEIERLYERLCELSS
jgi:hypothetical protein